MGPGVGVEGVGADGELVGRAVEVDVVECAEADDLEVFAGLGIWRRVSGGVVGVLVVSRGGFGGGVGVFRGRGRGEVDVELLGAEGRFGLSGDDGGLVVAGRLEVRRLGLAGLVAGDGEAEGVAGDVQLLVGVGRLGLGVDLADEGGRVDLIEPALGVGGEGELEAVVEGDIELLVFGDELSGAGQLAAAGALVDVEAGAGELSEVGGLDAQGVVVAAEGEDFAAEVAVADGLGGDVFVAEGIDAGGAAGEGQQGVVFAGQLG